MRNWHVTTDEIPSRVFSMNVGHYLWGIDTSFFFELSDGTIDWSDITYEELTRISLVINEKWFSVISRTLPMRNWHASNNPVVVSRKNIFVGHYLWGIDTSICREKAFPKKIVGHYLWGIDTCVRIKIPWYIRKEKVGHYLWGIDTFTVFVFKCF